MGGTAVFAGTRVPVQTFLRARTNRLADLQPLAPDLLERLAAARPGTVTYVGG